MSVKAVEGAEFSVDTGLFRQLGELLVGRDSTALVELVKNSYDADATRIVLHGENLGSPDNAVVTVADNGVGMTQAQFERGFLRLAASGKVLGDRRSQVYRRRYTGEKGVGRLAAHKLAAMVEVTSVAAVDSEGNSLAQFVRSEQPRLGSTKFLEHLEGGASSLVLAQIDWDLIEMVETLTQIEDGLIVESGPADASADRGTTLRLSRLRHPWTSSEIKDVVRQLRNFEPPQTLIDPIPPSVVSQKLLFGEPIVRDAHKSDPGISLDFQGDFTDPEEYWGNVLKTSEWVLEVRAQRGSDIEYSISPTRKGLSSNSFARGLTVRRPHPTPDVGPFFDARILLRSGAVPTIESSWTELNSGIRVYLEGFRIVPYGEPRNDWLSLDFEYTKRTGRFPIDPLMAGPSAEMSALRELADRDFSLRLLANRAFFGAVFLTESGAGGLRTLVNREGFVPDAAYANLVEIVSAGVRLLQRSRALASFRLKQANARRKKEQEAAASEEESDPTDEGDSDEESAGDGADDSTTDDPPNHDSSQPGDEWSLLGVDGSTSGSAAQLQLTLARLRAALGLPERDDDGVEDSDSAIDLAVFRAVREVERASDRLIEDSSLLRVLASVGSQLAAFTHELSLLVPMAVAAEAALAPIAGERWPGPAVHARRSVADLRNALERQASYLLDVASTEGRRRRSRQKLRERVDGAILGFQGAAATRSVALDNEVGKDIRTPPVFRAEIQAILTNVLSNAIKAAASPGRVVVSAQQAEDGVRIIVQNDGVRVDPAEAEEWFSPYASTTTDVDLVLGQGMGLGLPITRELVAEYGGTVRFVAPHAGYSTAVEIVIPE